MQDGEGPLSHRFNATHSEDLLREDYNASNEDVSRLRTSRKLIPTFY